MRIYRTTLNELRKVLKEQNIDFEHQKPWSNFKTNERIAKELIGKMPELEFGEIVQKYGNALVPIINSNIKFVKQVLKNLGFEYWNVQNQYVNDDMVAVRVWMRSGQSWLEISNLQREDVDNVAGLRDLLVKRGAMSED